MKYLKRAKLLRDKDSRGKEHTWMHRKRCPIASRCGTESRKSLRRWRMTDGTDSIESEFVQTIDNPPPYSVTGNTPGAAPRYQSCLPWGGRQSSHLDGAGNRIQHTQRRLVSTTLLVWVAFAPHGDGIHGRNRQLFTLPKAPSFLPLTYVKCVKNLSVVQKVLAVKDICMYNREN